jgi:histidinol dehydrogenase
MMRQIDLTGSNWSNGPIDRALLPRGVIDVKSVMPVAEEIIQKVRIGGEREILEICAQLDGIAPITLRVPQDVIESAFDSADQKFIEALSESKKRVELVHRNQVPMSPVTEVVPGGKVTNQWIAINRVGLYVPGGRGAYPSSVVMNVVPALVAGVGSMMIMSPPSRENNGWPHPSVLAAAHFLGVTEIYSVGGAQAIAMAAYGIGCDPVDLITGPGNIYVTAAKRALQGLIGIDSEAGPTEVAILADESGNAKFIAADLISQAEHDVIAASVLVTTSRNLANAVLAELDQQVSRTKHQDRIRQALAGNQSGIVLVDTIEQGLKVVDAYAAEHLEIHTAAPQEVARRVKNAGAIFVGPYSPVSLGDYLAGSNHVLPTGGCACHSSGLGTSTFLKMVTLVEYDQDALLNAAPLIKSLAETEDLPAHWQAISKRFDDQ